LLLAIITTTIAAWQYKPGLQSQNRKESDVFGWSRIPKNTKSWSRFFCPTLDDWLDHFLHYTPKLGISSEMVELLLKLLVKQIFLTIHHDFHWFEQPNFIPFMCRSRKFWKVGVGYFTSKSATL